MSFTVVDVPADENGVTLDGNATTLSLPQTDSETRVVSQRSSSSVSSSSRSRSQTDEDDDDRRCSCLKRCLHTRCHEGVECAGCLAQCTCELHKWCRHAECGKWLRNTFTLENATSKFPVVKWLPKYRLAFRRNAALID